MVKHTVAGVARPPDPKTPDDKARSTKAECGEVLIEGREWHSNTRVDVWWMVFGIKEELLVWWWCFTWAEAVCVCLCETSSGRGQTSGRTGSTRTLSRTGETAPRRIEARSERGNGKVTEREGVK